MRYAILGGDLRFAHLTRMLQERGREAAGFLQETAGGEALQVMELKGYDCIISNWPMRWPLSKQQADEAMIMENIAPGSVLLLCGPKFPRERRWDLKYINLWEDEALLQENAWLTAEAAVGSAMARLQAPIAGMRCMVVGYGRIGRALTEILVNLHARVTVMTGKQSKRSLAAQSGAETALIGDLPEMMPRQKLIFSTPPAMVIDRAALAQVDGDALIIDLASPPYGVNLEAAREMGLHAIREPSLPGRWCPLSAARAIYNAVIRWEEEENHD